MEKQKLIGLNNATILTTRVIQILRYYTGGYYVDERLAEELGTELAKLIPEGVKLNPVKVYTSEQILDWIEEQRLIEACRPGWKQRLAYIGLALAIIVLIIFSI